MFIVVMINIQSKIFCTLLLKYVNSSLEYVFSKTDEVFSECFSSNDYRHFVFPLS